MKRPIFTRLGALFLLLVMLVLTASCGSTTFFEEEATYKEIKSFTAGELMPNGTIEIIVTYFNEDMPPDTFYVPYGRDGVNGVGISSVAVERDERNRQTNICITYTNNALPVTNVNVPDGVSVIGLEEREHPDTGEPYIVFLYSDKSESAPIDLPRGERGLGIKRFEPTTNNDLSVSIVVELDDGSRRDFLIPAPIQGNGIAEIEAFDDPATGKYVLLVTFTDENIPQKRLEFPRPADAMNWYTGNEPPSSLLGRNGEFFFDIQHRVIWAKQNDTWHDIVDFKDTETTYPVTFDLNDAPEYNASLNGMNSIYNITHGSYFSANGYDLPIPTRPGYNFLGWYTKRTVDERVMSPFTDLTTVSSPLTLYARWEKLPT